MNTYQATPLITAFLSDEPLEPQHLGYLRARAQNQAHECVLAVFEDESTAHGVTRAYIARRLKKRPEVVGRCLTAPGNWTLDTLAELLGSMGYEVEFRARSFREPNRTNRVHDFVATNTSPVNLSSGRGPVVIYTKGTTATSTSARTGGFVEPITQLTSG
jgi:hypothetical protein